MGIFDIFKNIFKKNEGEEKDKKVGFHELDSHIIKLKEENKAKEKEVLRKISDLIIDLIKELEEKNEVIKKIDLKDKKEQEKVKLMVLDGIFVYSEQIERLINSLENIKLDELQKNIAELNIIFDDFARKSRMGYEKATILVGKEMATIKESLKQFSNKIGIILEENKKLIKSLEIIEKIEIKILKINNFEKENEEIKLSFDKINKEIIELKEKRKEIENKLENIKKSENYLEIENARKEAVQDRVELDKEIFKLKELINFKELEKTFHSDERKMKIVRKYKEDFNQIFIDDEEILSLIEKEKLYEITDLLINIKERKIKSEEIIHQKDDSKTIELELAYIDTQIEKFTFEKEKDEKREVKNKENIDWIKKEITEDLEYMQTENI